MANGVFDRAGVAYQSGLAIGASVATGQASDTNDQAKKFAQMSVGDWTALGNQQKDAAQQDFQNVYTGGRVPTAWENSANTFIENNVAKPVVRAMDWLATPVRKVGDYVETNVRTYSNMNESKGDQILSLLQIGQFWDADWRKTFDQVSNERATPAQTLWAYGKSVIAPDQNISREDPYKIFDQNNFSEREEYFGGGAAMWTTGILDAGFNLVADPLIVGGKALGAVRGARNLVRAEDVASAFSKATTATSGARRIDAFVNAYINASEKARLTEGGYATMFGNKAWRQGADQGNIINALRRADDVVDDAERLSMKREIIYSGMGNKDAIAALAQRDADLSLWIEDITGPNQAFARDSILARTDRRHIDNLRDIAKDDWTDRYVQQHLDEIKAERDALNRVTDAATGGATAEQLATQTAPGFISQLPDSVRLNAARFNPQPMGIGKTIVSKYGLPPIHMLFGQHVPYSVDLTDDGFMHTFGSMVMSTTGKVARKSNLDPELRSLLDDAATTYGNADIQQARIQRNELVNRLNALQTERLAQKYAKTEGEQELVKAFITKVRENRTDEMANLSERAYQAFQEGRDEFHVTDRNGVLVLPTREYLVSQYGPDFIHPGTILSPTQTAQTVPGIDWQNVEGFLKRQSSKGWDGFIDKLPTGAFRWTETLANTAEQLWKFGALLRPGYTTRNLLDNSSRDIAMMGLTRTAQFAMEGARNLRWNIGRIPAEAVDTLQQVSLAKTRLETVDDLLSTSTDAALEAERLQLTDAIASGEQRLQEIAAGGTTQGTVRIGKTIQARHIGMSGDMPAFRNYVDFRTAGIDEAAAKSVAGVFGANDRGILEAFKPTDDVVSISASHPGWSKYYVEYVNKIVRNDKGLLSILAGAGDDVIRKWYTQDRLGRVIWDGLKKNYHGDLDLYIQTQRRVLTDAIPDTIKPYVLGGEINETIAKQLAREERPAVPMPTLRKADGPARGIQEAAAYLDRARGKWFKIAGEMPESSLGRLPFYVARKEKHLSDLWPRATDGSGPASLTADQINGIYRRADALAKRDVAEYLFDTAKQSNISAHLRLFMPFYSAWSDTMRKWMRIAGYNPATVGYWGQALGSFNSAFTVVDKDGNRIERDGSVIGADGKVVGYAENPFDGNIVLARPAWLGGKARTLEERMGSAKIAKNALNVTFQGQPFWLPSPGPLMTIPANVIADKYMPDLVNKKFFGDYLFPVGAQPSITSGVLPTWVNNLTTLGRAEYGSVTGDPRAYEESRLAQTYANIMATKMNDIERGESPQMTQGELMDYAGKATRNWWILRFASNWMGASVLPSTKLEFYQNQYRAYRRQYGANADEKFLADYPEFSEATISLSKNETGIQANDDTWENSSKYATGINRNQQYGWAYVGAANLAPGFDEGVYSAQQSRGWRTSKSPVDAYNDTQVTKGWIEYNQVNNAIQEKLASRQASGGPASLTAKANADLKSIRDQYLLSLKQRNPEWANSFEQGSTKESVNAFFRWADNAQKDYPDLAKRSDFQALDSYIQVRTAIRAKLDERGLATVESDGADDLAEIWSQYTTKLQQSDLGFQQMWTRAGLDRDKIARG